MGDPGNRGAYKFGPFQLDVRERRLSRGSEVIPLRLKVFDTLRILVENAGRLITKQELLDTVWPDAAVEENNLNHNVSVLRKVLGEKATGQRYIETVPRVGYRFVAAVEVAELPLAAFPAPAPPSGHSADADLALAAPNRRPLFVLLAVATVIAAAATWYYLVAYDTSGRSVVLGGKDSVLIADFVNTTGDSVFDGTLRQAVAVQLGQTPFLNIVSEERVRETLRYMERSPDERVTRDLAREIAQRQGTDALLVGSIASLGRHYVISLEAVSAVSGDTIAREQVEAESRERVLARLGEATTSLRQKFGESLASVERFSAPIEQATTPSLEAFKAYDLGRRKHFAGQYFEAIPLYRRAVELDPNFAIAYAGLGITYGTAREYDLAAQFSRRAFELRERVSEREKFYISARYYMDVLHDGDRAIEALELWTQTYPRDFVPRTNLSARYAAIGRYPEALEAARDGVRLNPDAGVAYAALAHSSICLGQHRRLGRLSTRPWRASSTHPTAATCCTGLPSCRAIPRPCSSRSTARQERQPKPGCWRCNQWRRPLPAGCATRGTTLYARSSWPGGAGSQKVPGPIPPATRCGKRRTATAARPDRRRHGRSASLKAGTP